MVFSEKLAQIRGKAGISQDKLAQALNVSRQAVQKWESGASVPDQKNLIAIAAYFNVSIDYLLTGKDTRDVETMRVSAEPIPNYEKQHSWEAYFKCMEIEYQQSIEEGHDLDIYEDLFRAVAKMPDDRHKAQIADVIASIVDTAPLRADYPYVEPSDLETIRLCATGTPRTEKLPPTAVLRDRMKGAWYGRICGCLLGKPVEGISCEELTTFLRRSGNSPMHRYITKTDADTTDQSGISFPLSMRAYDDGVLDGMPIDDDTNYIVLAYMLLDRNGRDFTPEDMAQVWLSSQPKDAYCTAERVAFRNLVNGYLPPESGQYQNPYREWIGAQIRGDFFGWINPGDPEAAAAMAWRDACMSHVKNGIYGEMWVAAMLAAVGAGATIEESIHAGLACIPQKSRLHEALTRVIEWYHSGKTAESFFADFHTRWNDRDQHHWCHTISNAEIVTAALLYGEGDYGKTICMAVEQGFDTDCNGATAGSVVGMALGYEKLPRIWTDKIGGKLNTSIFGYEKVDVSEMAEKSMRFLKK